MSKATLELISKLHAKLSDAYETLASDAEDDTPPAKAPAKAKAKAAEPDEEDDDLPAPKKAGTTGKPKTPAKKAAAAEPDEEEITEQDIIAAAAKLIKATDRATAVKIIKKHGGEKVADIDEDKYPALLAALQKATPSEDDATDPDEDI